MAVSDVVFYNFTVSDNCWLFVEYLSSRKVTSRKNRNEEFNIPDQQGRVFIKIYLCNL